MERRRAFLLLFLAVLASSLTLGYIMGVQTARQYFTRRLEEDEARAKDFESRKARIQYDQIKEVVKAFNQIDREHIYFACIDGTSIMIYRVSFDGAISPVIKFTYEDGIWIASKVWEGGEPFYRTLSNENLDEPETV